MTDTEPTGGRSSLISLEGGDRVTFDRSLTVGRHPFNGLVLGHPRVSARHAVLEWEPGGWHLRDLGSRNGTTVNDRKFGARRALKAGDVVRFGGVSAWRIEALVEPHGGAIALVENAASSRCVPVLADRFLVGTAPPCDLVVAEWLDEAQSPIRLVLFEEAGALWLDPAGAVDGLEIDGAAWTGGARVLDRDVLVRLGSTALKITPVTGAAAFQPTERAGRREKTYDLDLHLAFDGPAEGTVRVVAEGGEWSVRAGQPFVLLYLLCRAGGEWVVDDELKVRIWGRPRADDLDRSALNKLIHDTRKLFIARGVDGWFIEKVSGRTRVRLPPDRLHVVEPAGTK